MSASDRYCAPKLVLITANEVGVGKAQDRPTAEDLAPSGKVSVKAMELGRICDLHRVISTRLAEGRTMVHIIADSDPGDGFSAVRGDLEDVYFATLAQMRSAA